VKSGELKVKSEELRVKSEELKSEYVGEQMIERKSEERFRDE